MLSHNEFMKNLIALPIALSCTILPSQRNEANLLEELFEHEFDAAFPEFVAYPPLNASQIIKRSGFMNSMMGISWLLEIIMNTMSAEKF